MLRLATLIVVPSLCLTALTACGEDDKTDTLPAPAPDETTSTAPSQSPGQTPSIKASPQRLGTSEGDRHRREGARGPVGHRVPA